MKRLVPVLLLVPFALLQIGGCGGGSGGDDPIFPPDAVSVSVTNYDATPYDVSVLTSDSSGGGVPVFTETFVASLDAGGSGGAQISLPPTSATVSHNFLLRDPATGGLLDTSAEFVKGSSFQTVLLQIQAGSIF